MKEEFEKKGAPEKIQKLILQIPFLSYDEFAFSFDR